MDNQSQINPIIITLAILFNAKLIFIPTNIITINFINLLLEAKDLWNYYLIHYTINRYAIHTDWHSYRLTC